MKRASSGTPKSADQEADAPVLGPASGARAPDLAAGATGIATIAPGLSLERIDRPVGAVTVDAGEGAAFVARINLLARRPVSGGRSSSQLKQCIAPDFMVMAAPERRVVVAAHAAQSVMVLRATPAAFVSAAGAEVHQVAGAIHGRILADGLMTGLVERLFDVAGRDAALAGSLFRTLCLSLVESTRAVARAPHRGGLTERQLSRLRTHIEGNLDQPLPITALSDLVGLSPFHFARAFKTSMGAAPATWIRLRRLTVGQRMLQNPALSVTDVAAAVGYDSPSRFARAFRAVTGESPSQYRRRIAHQGLGPSS